MAIEEDVTSKGTQHKSLRQYQAEWDNEAAADNGANALNAATAAASSPDDPAP